MNTWKKQENKFMLMYYMKWNLACINEIIQVDKKSKLKNYWLQKKEDKEHDNKLEKIAEFVTKYIKAQTKG